MQKVLVHEVQMMPAPSSASSLTTAREGNLFHSSITLTYFFTHGQMWACSLESPSNRVFHIWLVPVLSKELVRSLIWAHFKLVAAVLSP